MGNPLAICAFKEKDHGIAAFPAGPVHQFRYNRLKISRGGVVRIVCLPRSGFPGHNGCHSNFAAFQVVLIGKCPGVISGLTSYLDLAINVSEKRIFGRHEFYPGVVDGSALGDFDIVEPDSDQACLNSILAISQIQGAADSRVVV